MVCRTGLVFPLGIASIKRHCPVSWMVPTLAVPGMWGTAGSVSSFKVLWITERKA